MSPLSLAAALRVAQRALVQTAEAMRPELAHRIADGKAEAAAWAEEAAEGAELRIAGDGLEPDVVRRIVAETFSTSGQGNGA